MNFFRRFFLKKHYTFYKVIFQKNGLKKLTSLWVKKMLIFYWGIVRNGGVACRPGLAYMGFIPKIGVTTIPGGPPAQNPGSKSPGYPWPHPSHGSSKISFENPERRFPYFDSKTIQKPVYITFCFWI